MSYPKIYKCGCGKMIYAFSFSDIEMHEQEDDCIFAFTEVAWHRASERCYDAKKEFKKFKPITLRSWCIWNNRFIGNMINKN